MIITRKKQVPLSWVFYAQIPLMLSIYGNYVINTPFLLMMKKFIDNPAAIMGLISIEFWVTILGAPFTAWLSDRIWTSWGRRKGFLVVADAGKGLLLMAMPFAPNLWVLIVLRWLYGAVGDFGSMTQALIYEVVPSKQRGKLSGFFQCSIQVGNLVYFFLLLGRFDDVYFMGPFMNLTKVSGGALLFWVAALPFLAVALFEALGFKEIRPPNIRLLKEERPERVSLLKYFSVQFVKDILAKDFMPLYLLVVVNVMFGVGLGVFRPLLFTEQWGYNLQDLGNIVAIGTVTTVVFSLLSGWVADRWGKMPTFLGATVFSFLVNVFYTVYVFFQPDHRPSILEIIIIGNVGATANMIKGVVSFPLMMEYVKRDRMGAANAGIGFFTSLFRNLITLFVGIWLVWWSVWFFPQAGSQIELTFPSEMSETELRTLLSKRGVKPESYLLQPLHAYGVDGETSSRWWIHENDKQIHEGLARRKDLVNNSAPLRTKLDSPFLDEEERSEMEADLAAIEAEIEEIDERLTSSVQELEQRIYPNLQEDLYSPGSQLRSLEISENKFVLVMETLEPLPEDLVKEYLRILESPQYLLLPGEGNEEWRSALQVTPLSENGYAIRSEMTFDPAFLLLQAVLSEKLPQVESRFDLGNGLLTLLRVSFGKESDAYQLDEAVWDGDLLSLKLHYPGGMDSEKTEALPDLFSAEDWVESASIQEHDSNNLELKLQMILPEPETETQQRQLRREEVEIRIRELVDVDPEIVEMMGETVLRFVDALVPAPFYITVPEHTPRFRYQEREYEYFFSSQMLMIATDLFGFWIVFLLVRLEKKGVVHRSGVEEDEER